MNQLKEIKIIKGKESSLQRFHPWIFSGAIQTQTSSFQEGDLMRVLSHGGQFLALAYYCNSSITGRVLSFSNVEINQHFWNAKISKAIHYRRALHVFDSNGYNACRLINGEGDGIPGLIVDFYNGFVVMQFHNAGILKFSDQILEAFQLSLGKAMKNHVIRKTNDDSDTKSEAVEKVIIQENGIQFIVDPIKGQKTGFFLDQRNNRKLLGSLCKDKKVLNTFCYTGGFSLYALMAGASEVVSIDYSKSAIQLLEENVELNRLQNLNHHAITGDALHYLQTIPNDFDIIVLDPPAFAKNLKARHNAVQAYKRINKLAMEKVKSGGLIFTFSCSQVVDLELFQKTIFSAAIEAGRTIKVTHRLGASEDHPVSIFHPEGTYLKGLVLYVES
jgi:23S rRNA (cytosine1962-C5)-methyltransferase